ncbi:hypothetical protein Esti_005641 [Eimeria stiedai]
MPSTALKINTSSRLLSRFFLIAAAASSCVSAWSDEGHLLVATIAKLLLPPRELEHFETILSKWNDDFPGTGSLQTAAIWLDHLSCKDPSPYCSGFKALDDVQVFRTWHYSTHVLNPQNLELKGVYKYYPLPKAGAEWALSTVYESLKEVNPQVLPSILSEASEKNKEKEEQQPSSPSNRGSPFSLNLHLRLLLHIFGDLHQPLHAGSLFARGFPDGDEGGNAIPVRHEAHIGNLHQLWDTGGGVFRKSFHDLTWKELQKKHQLSQCFLRIQQVFLRHACVCLLASATEIMEEFPRESLAHRLSGRLVGTDFEAIGQESAGVALKVAYSEFDWETFSKDALPFVPTEAYMERLRKEAKLQIALGGYRLAHVLSALAKEFLGSPKQQQQQELQEQQQQKLVQEALSGDWAKLKRVVESSVSAFSRLAAPLKGSAEHQSESASSSSSNNSSNSSSSSKDARISEASDSPLSSSLLSSLQPLPRLLLQVAGSTVMSWSSNPKSAGEGGLPSSGAPLSEGGPSEEGASAAAAKPENQKKEEEQQQEVMGHKDGELNLSEL